MKSNSRIIVSAFLMGGILTVSQPSFAKGFKFHTEDGAKQNAPVPQYQPAPKYFEKNKENDGTQPQEKKFYNPPQMKYPHDNNNQAWQKPPQEAPKQNPPPQFKFGDKSQNGFGNNNGQWQGGNQNWGHNKNGPSNPPPQANPPQGQPQFKFKEKDKNWNGGNHNGNYQYGNGQYGNGNHSNNQYGNNHWGNNQKHFNKPNYSQPFTNFHFKKDKGHDYWGPHGKWNNWNNSWGDPYYYARRWGFDEWHPHKGWRRGKYWYSHPSQWSDWGGWFSFFLSSGGIWGFSYDSGYDPYYSNYGNECLRLYDQDWYYGRRAVYSFIGCRDNWGRFIEIHGTRRFENYAY